MCGISGFVTAGSARRDELESVARAMAGALAHRGPDDAGVWVDAEHAVALSHRRLSIVDLSAEGHQPMVSADGRYVIVFNGEIYNFEQIRRLLEDDRRARGWRGHSDTEVLVEAVCAWGLERTLACAVGMFAFAIWDRSTRSLCLARDRMGEKPLYYGWMRESFVFASELKALKAHPAFEAAIDRNALSLYTCFGYVPSPCSIYSGVRKLPPGTTLRLSAADISIRALPAPLAYWSVAGAVRDGRGAPFSGTVSEAADTLDSLLKRSVAGQMVADVPLGAFLSGGVDSSTAVALMQAQSPRPVRTFSIGFAEADYNEAEQAGAVARHLQTDHTDLYVTPREALAVVPQLPAIYDEPFADASQIPTYLVAKLARAHVTVSLSGDGGDELFGGYNRYAWSGAFDRHLGSMPMAARRAAAWALTLLRPARWDAAFRLAAPMLPAAMRQRLPGDKLHKLAAALPYASHADLYGRLVSHWHGVPIVQGGTPCAPVGWNDHGGMPVPEEMMAADMVGYLPDDILVKVDRAAMAVSLETRVPMLDHRVVEFAWKLPLEMKIQGTRGKVVLREVLARYVPPLLTERAKMGFSVPLDGWLRGPLRDWAEALLAPARLQREGFLAPAPIRTRWQQHLAGTHNWQQSLWTVLMFQAWLQTQHA